MNYKLIWKKAALQDLAEVWLNAADRNLVTDITAWLESQLIRAPLSLGESRTSSVHRVKIQPPLAIEFVVIEDDKKVIVRAAWAMRMNEFFQRTLRVLVLGV